MTRIEREYLKRLRDVLKDPARPDAEARSRARVQTTLILKVDAARRRLNRDIRRAVEATERRRANGQG